MMATSKAKKYRAWAIGLSLLFATAAHAGPFFDEVTGTPAVLDHRGHDHSNESNSDVPGAGVDASCLTPGPMPTGCASFRRSLFFDSDLESSDFSDADLGLTEITTTLFSLSVLAGADLDDAYIERSDFDDADLTNATLRRATVRAGSFDRADFTGADLTDAQFRCIADPDVDNNDDAASLCPSFVQTVFDGADLTSALFAPAFSGDEIPFSATDFSNADLTDAVLAGVVEPCLQTDAANNTWSCLVFGGNPAPTTVVDGLSLLDESDLRGSDWRGLTLRDTFLPGSRIAGARFDGATIVDSDFQQVDAHCRIDGTNAEDDLCTFLDANGQESADFSNTTISGTTFLGADLRATDFSDADLSDVVFDEANLGCSADPKNSDDCSNCAILSGALDNQVALPDGAYNISLQSIDWDRIVPCSQIQLDAMGTALIDDLSHIQLDGGSFRGVDVTALDFVGSGLANVSFREATISGVDFDGADLSGANLTDAVDPCTAADGCASFVGANLSSATLSGTAFPGASFDDAVLDGAVAVDTDFSGASFAGSETSAVGAVFSSSVFDGASFSDADLTGMRAVCLTSKDETVCASFQGTTFASSDLTGVDLRGADLRGATFPGSDLQGASFADADFDALTSFAMAQIDGLDLSGVDLSDASPTLFQGLTPFVPEDDEEPTGVNLGASDLDGFDLSNLDLTNWTFDDSSLVGVSFSGATLDGASFANIPFDEVFAGLTVDSTFFRGAILQASDLRGLDLTGFDFTGADLTGATVRSTNFTGADFTGAKLVDLQKICDDGNDCADFEDAVLTCADLSDTNFGNFATGIASPPAGTGFFKDTDSGFDLTGIVLAGNDLRSYDFTNTDLTHADLGNSDVRGADFTGANLSGASFEASRLCLAGSTPECPIFANTDIAGSGDCDDEQGADFSGVDFSEAPDTLFDGTNVLGDATCVNFSNAVLSHPDATSTTGFDFTDFTTFSNAVLAGAQLRYQDLSSTTLGDADFFQQLAHAPEFPDDPCVSEDTDLDVIDTSPDLRETAFDCAQLDGQNLGGADLREATFIQTNLDGVSFTDAELESTDFSNVVFDDSMLADVFQDIATVKQDPDDPDSDEVVDEDGVPYPNLQNVIFANADLQASGSPVNLSHVDLRNAVLDGARLDDTDLRDAIFDDAASLCGDTPTTLCNPLEGTSYAACVGIDGAMVEGASFRSMSFRELFDDDPDAANFFQSVAAGNLRGVNFNFSNIAGLRFDNLDMTDAAIFAVSRFCKNGSCASFENTTFGSSDPEVPLIMTAIRNFQSTSLAGANFDNVDLTGTDLSTVGELCTESADCLSITGANTSLQSVDFRKLDLTGVDFGSGADAVVNFENADFRRANLSGLASDVTGRDFTGADFVGADLSGLDFEDSILASISSGCVQVNGSPVCTSFDGASLCGVDARSATFEGSFDGTSAWPAGCSTPAHLGGASFGDSQLATLDLSFANLQGAHFDPSVDFCDGNGQCLVIQDANLFGVDFAGNDFSELPDAWFQAAANRDLGETDFSEADLSGKILYDTAFAYANLSGADLRNADLRNAVFDDAQFAEGATASGGRCSLASGGQRVDLRGANLSGADFSRAKNFLRGCIRVDASTTYDARTRFPVGFDLLGSITPVPEPSSDLLRAAALTTLAWLARRRVQRRPSRSTRRSG